MVDNAKGRGRAPRIDSACLERSITDEVLSFRLLGHSREIRAENSHQFCLTANTPDVSRGLVTRSVVVGLYHEGDPARRAFDLPDPEGYALAHRAELLGELAGLVERWLAAGGPRAEARSRFNKKGWEPVVDGILRAGGFPDFLGNAGAAVAELDDTRREFADLVAALADHPQGAWTAAELADLAGRLFGADAGKESGRALATRVGILAGRFVGESFALDDGRRAEFQRPRAGRGTSTGCPSATPTVAGATDRRPHQPSVWPPPAGRDNSAGVSPNHSHRRTRTRLPAPEPATTARQSSASCDHAPARKRSSAAASRPGNSRRHGRVARLSVGDDPATRPES